MSFERMPRHRRFRTGQFTNLAIGCAFAILSSACHDSSGPQRRRVGDVLWRVEEGYPETRQWWGIPAVSGTRLFVDIGNSLRAYDTHTGRQLWSTRVRPEPLPDSKIIHAQNGFVLMSDPAAIIALDEVTGAIRWRMSPNDSLIQSYGTVDSRAYYTGTRGGFVFALDVNTGGILWEASMQLDTDWFAANIIGLAVSGDTLIVSGIFRRDSSTFKPQGFIAALDRNNGHRWWKYETNALYGSGIYSAAAITRDLVLQGDVLQKRFIALNRYTGEQRWFVQTDPAWGGPGSVPFVVDDMVYFGTHGGVVYGVDVNTGATRWSTATGSSVDEVVVCGRYAFAKNQGADILNAKTGAKVRLVIADPDDFLTSGLVASGNSIFGTGVRAAYALSCG